MANYTVNTWNSGDTITKTKMDRLEAGAAAALPSADAPELIRDTIGTALVAGSNMTVTVSDAGDTITLASSGAGGGGYATVADEGSSLTQRATLNIIGRNVAAVDNAGSSRTDVTVRDVATVHTVGNSTASLTLDAASSSGPVKTITLNANCTFTFSAVTSGLEMWMVLVLTQDATGSRLVTWPGSVKWSPGAAPTLSTPAGAVDRVLVTTYDGGTIWYGDVIGKNYA